MSLARRLMTFFLAGARANAGVSGLAKRPFAATLLESERRLDRDDLGETLFGSPDQHSFDTANPRADRQSATYHAAAVSFVATLSASAQSLPTCRYCYRNLVALHY